MLDPNVKEGKGGLRDAGLNQSLDAIGDCLALLGATRPQGAAAAATAEGSQELGRSPAAGAGRGYRAMRWSYPAPRCDR